jgi:hypothetical protein
MEYPVVAESSAESGGTITSVNKTIFRAPRLLYCNDLSLKCLCILLDPNINKTQWTAEEELIMTEAHRELGNKWSEIAKRLPGRTDNHVKNHWYSFMRRNVRKLNRDVVSIVGGQIPILPGTAPIIDAVQIVKKATTAEEAIAAAAAAVAIASATAATYTRDGSSFREAVVASVSENADGPVQYEVLDLSNAAKQRKASKKHRNSSRKQKARRSSSLAELQKCFKAASEVAEEVLAEQGPEALGGIDIKMFSEQEGIEWNDPSRMLALGKANENFSFRYIISQKLNVPSMF